MKQLPNQCERLFCDLNRLDQFLQADHYRLEDESLISHLDSCSSCREYLAAQAADETTWRSAAELLRPREFDQASQPEYSAASTLGASVAPPSAAVREILANLAPTDDPHHLGRIGPYEVVGVVGFGAMGVVLKAIDPALDRVVAVKVMAPRLANNDQARKRFAREAKAAAAVLHPNVIPIHSVSSEGALPYLVMAFNRGGSLQKRLEKDAPLSLVEVLRIGSQIAAGLAAAHEQGLVHRDIKPENILLEEGVERVAITDFGLARAVDDNTLTQYGAIAGTPMYMSPEQARGEQVDQRSDLFSLGSVLYALSTGGPPYRADNSYGVMRRIIDESPSPIRQLNPEIPDWLAAVISRLMAKDKANRFSSATEVHKLLEACLSHAQQPEAIPLPEIPGLNLQVAPRTLSILNSRIGVIAMSIAASAALFAAIIISQVNRPSITVVGPETPVAKAAADGKVMPAPVPGLIIQSQNHAGANGGEKGKYTWKLNGKSVETMTIRVLHIENGITRVVNESIYQGGAEGEQRIEVELKLKDVDRPLPVPAKLFIPTLAVSVNGLQATTKTGEMISFPGSFQGQSESIGGSVAKNKVLGWLAYDHRKVEVADSLDSIVEASKNGPTFLVTTVDWKGHGPAAATNAANDYNDIQGTWQVTYAEKDGVAVQEDDFKLILLTFTKQNLTTHIDDKKSESTYTLNTSTSPKSIDITEQGRTKRGIYDLQGDTLRICVANRRSKGRPTEFDSQPNSPNSDITVLKRVKAASDVKAEAADTRLALLELNVKQAVSVVRCAEAEANRISSLYSRRLVPREELEAKNKELQDRVFSLEKARLLLEQSQAIRKMQSDSAKANRNLTDPAKLQAPVPISETPQKTILSEESALEIARDRLRRSEELSMLNLISQDELDALRVQVKQLESEVVVREQQLHQQRLKQVEQEKSRTGSIPLPVPIAETSQEISTSELDKIARLEEMLHDARKMLDDAEQFPERNKFSNERLAETRADVRRYKLELEQMVKIVRKKKSFSEEDEIARLEGMLHNARKMLDDAEQFPDRNKFSQERLKEAREDVLRYKLQLEAAIINAKKKQLDNVSQAVEEPRCPLEPVSSDGRMCQEQSNEVQSEQSNTSVDVRKMIEQGMAAKRLPEGMSIHVAGCMGEAAGKRTGCFIEKWEFSSGEVHRAKYKTVDGKTVTTRLESKKYDTSGLCKTLLDGKALEIQARKGTGPDTILAGTKYRRGSRSIVVELKGETLLELSETNGPFLHVYRETDAQAFGKLYEQLGSAARSVFGVDPD